MVVVCGGVAVLFGFGGDYAGYAAEDGGGSEGWAERCFSCLDCLGMVWLRQLWENEMRG